MHVVLVEDNFTLQKSTVKVLTDEGHQVQSFSDGETARAWLMAEHERVDVGIFDYMLPKLDGVSLIELLRAENITFPILMLTARDTVSDKVIGLSSGADYYLTKPFEFDELLACLSALHRRPQTYQAEMVTVSGNVILDAKNRSLSAAGECVPLTPTEFGILEYLVRRRGEVVSQQDIYEHVFDFAKENWSNTIEVHIKNLRKKLQKENHEDIITTIRGVGYTLAD